MVDLQFVVDSSSSVNRINKNFPHAKDFIKHVSSIFELRNQGVRVGVVKYSTAVSLEIEIGSINSQNDFNNAVDAIGQSFKNFK